MGKDDGTERSKPLEGAQECEDAQGAPVRAFTTVMDALDFRVRGRTKFKASEISLITLCSIASGGTSVALCAKFFSSHQPVFSNQQRRMATSSDTGRCPLAAGC